MLGFLGCRYPVALVTDEGGRDVVIHASYGDGSIFGEAETKQDAIDGCYSPWSFRDEATGELVQVEDTPFSLSRLPYPGRPYSLIVMVRGGLERWVSLDLTHWEPWERYRRRLIEGNGELPEECAD